MLADGCKAASRVRYAVLVDVERIIDDIEQLEEMFEAPDIRPLSASDVSAANRRHDKERAHSAHGSGSGRIFEFAADLKLRDSNSAERTTNLQVGLQPKPAT